MGWFIVTVALPLCVPIVALLLLKTLPLPEPTSLIRLVKDGQLCWIAIGFCASALYDISTQGTVLASDQTGYLSGGFTAVLCASGLIAAVGTVFPTGTRSENIAWHKHYATFIMSLALTIASGGAFTVLHYFLLKPHLGLETLCRAG